MGLTVVVVLFLATICSVLSYSARSAPSCSNKNINLFRGLRFWSTNKDGSSNSEIRGSTEKWEKETVCVRRCRYSQSNLNSYGYVALHICKCPQSFLKDYLCMYIIAGDLNLLSEACECVCVCVSVINVQLLHSDAPIQVYYQHALE